MIERRHRGVGSSIYLPFMKLAADQSIFCHQEIVGPLFTSCYTRFDVRSSLLWRPSGRRFRTKAVVRRFKKFRHDSGKNVRPTVIAAPLAMIGWRPDRLTRGTHALPAFLLRRFCRNNIA